MRQTNGERKKSKRLWRSAILLLFASSCLVSCLSNYTPQLNYDVLKPPDEVLLNPLGFTADGNIIVNMAYILWVDDLKIEIKAMRRAVKR